MPRGRYDGRPAFNISESEIRYAMQNTKSCSEAARFLKIGYDTFKKYAEMYIDSATGKTLFELHKNKPGKGLRRRTPPKYYRSKLEDILAGNHPKYDRIKLKRRLLRSGEFRECCDICGFDERRITDYTVPLILDWIDGDNTNHLRENLRFVCYNCYYLNIGNFLAGREKKIHL